MLINNEFVIERYDGLEPLTLLSVPPNMDSTTEQKYNTFIANILTIYGSQNIDGSIPVFFKNANGSPSSSSTLTQLDNGQEYYFISKNSSSFPYAIPSIGGPSVSSCETLTPCCPYIAFTNSSATLSGPPENIYAYLTANVSGLIPGREYSYEYELVAANWPSKISPMSGTFIPMGYSDTIEGVFNFCPVSGNTSGYLPFNYDINLKKDYIQKNIFSTLKIKLYPVDGSNCPLMTDSITVKCNKCLPLASAYRPEVTIVGGPKIALTSNCCVNPVPLTINVSGAEPGKIYDFSIETWPENVVSVPSGGQISFGDGIGRISTMINTNNQISTVIKVTLYDNDANEEFVDYSSLVCSTSC